MSLASKSSQNGISVQTKEFDPLQEKLKTDKKEAKPEPAKPSANNVAQNDNHNNQNTEMKPASSVAAPINTGNQVVNQENYYPNNAASKLY